MRGVPALVALVAAVVVTALASVAGASTTASRPLRLSMRLPAAGTGRMEILTVRSVAFGLAAASLVAAPAAAPAPQSATLRVAIPLPPPDVQTFALLKLKLQGVPARLRTNPDLLLAALKTRAANARELPSGIRAAAGLTRPIVNGATAQVEVGIAINNLGGARAVSSAAQTDTLYMVFDGRRPTIIRVIKKEIDSCPPGNWRKKRFRTKRIVYRDGGTSTAADILNHVYQDSLARGCAP